MDRRNFIQLVKGASASYLVLRITGCSPLGTDGGSHALADDPNATLVYDLVMHGYFNPDNDYLGDLTQPLLATQIRDYKQITLSYTQDDDGHTFQLGPAQFSKLLKGEAVEVLTTVNNNHNHIVKISPKDHAEGGQPIKVTVGPDGAPVDPGQPPPVTPPAATEKLYATMSEGDQPSLYAAATAELQDDSVQVCLDKAETCDATPGLWRPMKRYAARHDRQIFVSDGGLSLDPAGKDYPFVVRGKSKKDSTVLKFLLRIVAR